MVIPSTCPRPAEAVLKDGRGPWLRSFRNSLSVAPTTSTSTAASRFKGSCARGLFNVSLSLACLYLTKSLHHQRLPLRSAPTR